MELEAQHSPKAGVCSVLHEIDLQRLQIRPGQARITREETMISIMYITTWLTVLAVLTGFSADGSVLPKRERHFSRPLIRKRELKQPQLNTSALNTALAFEPYRDLATRTTAEPGVQQQQQHNLLFSPLGLASALALLSRVSGSESRSQALEALGLAANSTEQTVEATISALAELQQSLTMQEGGVQRAGAGPAAEADAGTRARAAEADIGVQGAGKQSAAAEDGADVQQVVQRPEIQSAGAEVQGGGAGVQLAVWSSLHVDGKPSLDYESFLTWPKHTRPTAFNNVSFETLMKDLQGSDKLILSNYVHFKGSLPFERRHTVLWSFQVNATASVEVPMMFRGDSSELRMLYDTNCSATVVKLPYSGRLASLLLLPKAELQPLEECLSDSRMSFWLSNLKPGRAEIRFPKFQLRKSYSLERLLRNSGVSSVFTNSANFSGVSPKKTLKLIKALHEVTLEVEETKSEDGGRSDVELDFSVPPRINFDRPFIFIIYDEFTGFVLVIGKIIDPREI
ncbi:uncharacterized protein ACN63O_015136 [Diretmus argenteus]